MKVWSPGRWQHPGQWGSGCCPHTATVTPRPGTVLLLLFSAGSKAQLRQDTPRALVFRSGGKQEKRKRFESLGCDHIMTLYTN